MSSEPPMDAKEGIELATRLIARGQEDEMRDATLIKKTNTKLLAVILAVLVVLAVIVFTVF